MSGRIRDETLIQLFEIHHKSVEDFNSEFNVRTDRIEIMIKSVDVIKKGEFQVVTSFF